MTPVYLFFILSTLIGAITAQDCTASETTASGRYAPTGTICSGDLIFEDNFDEFNLRKWEHEKTLAGGGVRRNMKIFQKKKQINEFLFRSFPELGIPVVHKQSFQQLHTGRHLIFEAHTFGRRNRLRFLVFWQFGH